jgi:hypothetical protein
MQEHLARALRAEGRGEDARAASEAGRAIARGLEDAALIAALDDTSEADLSTPHNGGG